MSHSYRRLVAGIVLALSLSLAVMGAKPAQAVSLPSYEIQNMKSIANTNLNALQLSSLCMGKGFTWDLLDKCHTIASNSFVRIQSLENWLYAWYHVGFTPNLSSADNSKLASLSTKYGTDFEINVIRALITQHQVGIGLDTKCLSYNNIFHSLLLGLCADETNTNYDEIVCLRYILVFNYGIFS